MTSRLGEFLAPRSIAVIGASKDPAKRGHQAIRTLRADGFPGRIYPIHPRESEILGLPAYPSIMAVEGDIDLALVCTAASTVPALLAECGRKGVKGAVVLAAGFSEIGEEGRRLEEAAVEAAARHGTRVVGPNTSGVFSLHSRMNLVGFRGVQPGRLGIVAQSGNIALSIVTEGQANGHVGFSTYVGIGNQADIRLDEYLEYLGEDQRTAVPILYVEGFKDGRRFLEVARRVTQKKPVVLYKAGRTPAGQRSARSHTGALAGSYELALGVLRQAGVTLVRDSDEIVPVAEALSLLPVPAGNRVAILADGGGHATIAADALTQAGLPLAPLSDDTRRRLGEILPPAASLANPVDVAGGTDANPGMFADCASPLLEDGTVDALLITGLFGGYRLRFAESLGPIEDDTAIRLGSLAKRFGKPVVLQSLYQPLRTDALVALRGAGVPVHASIETAVACVAALVDYARAKRRNRTRPGPGTAAPSPAARAILERAWAAGRRSLLEHEAKAVLRTYGIDIPAHLVARTPADLTRVSSLFGDAPLAMKVVSKDILHKTDAGGVRLDLTGTDAVRNAFEEVLANARAYAPAAEIEGVLIAPMAPKGVEVIIGATRDPTFGPVMMFGLGGVFVEILRDVVFRAVPLGRADAEEMLDGIKAGKVLEGVRGARPVDREALVDLMLKVSTIALAHPEIAEVDLNPVIAYADGYAVVDARMIGPAPEGSLADRGRLGPRAG